jgi:hypothetical protein
MIFIALLLSFAARAVSMTDGAVEMRVTDEPVRSRCVVTVSSGSHSLDEQARAGAGGGAGSARRPAARFLSLSGPRPPICGRIVRPGRRLADSFRPRLDLRVASQAHGQGAGRHGRKPRAVGPSRRSSRQRFGPGVDQCFRWRQSGRNGELLCADPRERQRRCGQGRVRRDSQASEVRTRAGRRRPACGVCLRAAIPYFSNPRFRATITPIRTR